MCREGTGDLGHLTARQSERKQVRSVVNRRQFLAGTAAAAGAGAQAAPPTLALNGGTPVREKPLSAGYWGSEFYDEKERTELMDVLDARSPFRWYGPVAV